MTPNGALAMGTARAVGHVLRSDCQQISAHKGSARIVEFAGVCGDTPAPDATPIAHPNKSRRIASRTARLGFQWYLAAYARFANTPLASATFGPWTWGSGSPKSTAFTAARIAAVGRKLPERTVSARFPDKTSTDVARAAARILSSFAARELWATKHRGATPSMSRCGRTTLSASHPR
jgi:hypothetical protein